MEMKDFIKQRRVKLGLTQKEVADYVGVSEATLSRWESGQIENLKRNRIAALAKILKVSPSLIVGKAEDNSSRWESSFRDSYWEQIGLAAPADCRELFDVEEWNQIVENDAITLDFACNVADTFGISLDAMTGLTSDSTGGLSSEEKRLLNLFRQADGYDRNIIWATLERYQKNTSTALIS